MSSSKYFDFDSIENYINKLDEYFPNIRKNINKKIQKGESFSYDSISKAFINQNDLNAINERYTNYFKVFDELLVILKKKNEDLKAVEGLPEFSFDGSQFEAIENSLVAFNKFYLYKTKLTILNLNKELINEDNEGRYKKLMTDLHDEFSKLEQSINKNKMSNTEFLEKDYQKLKELPTRYEKIKFKYWWIAGVTFVTGVVLLVVGIVLW